MNISGARHRLCIPLLTPIVTFQSTCLLSNSLCLLSCFHFSVSCLRVTSCQGCRSQRFTNDDKEKRRTLDNDQASDQSAKSIRFLNVKLNRFQYYPVARITIFLYSLSDHKLTFAALLQLRIKEARISPAISLFPGATNPSKVSQFQAICPRIFVHALCPNCRDCLHQVL